MTRQMALSRCSDVTSVLAAAGTKFLSSVVTGVAGIASSAVVHLENSTSFVCGTTCELLATGLVRIRKGSASPPLRGSIHPNSPRQTLLPVTMLPPPGPCRSRSSPAFAGDLSPLFTGSLQLDNYLTEAPFQNRQRQSAGRQGTGLVTCPKKRSAWPAQRFIAHPHIPARDRTCSSIRLSGFLLQSSHTLFSLFLDAPALMPFEEIRYGQGETVLGPVDRATAK